MASNPSYILAVVFLQQTIGENKNNAKVLPVVPLFETLNDLENSDKTMDALLSINVYREIISSKQSEQQEIMIGYPDSTKNAGILSASWAQYVAQEKLMVVAQK